MLKRMIICMWYHISAWQACAENVPPPVFVYCTYKSFSFPHMQAKVRMIWSLELWQENPVNTYGLLEIPWDQICPNLILTMMVCLLINCMFYPNFKTVNDASRAAYYIFPWIFAAAFLNLKQLWMMNDDSTLTCTCAGFQWIPILTNNLPLCDVEAIYK